MKFGFFMSAAFFANSFSYGALPNEVTGFIGKPGVYSSNGRNDTQGVPCQVAATGDSSIKIASSGSPWGEMNAVLIGAERRGATLVFKTSDTGKHPGGSVCGDITPMFNYSKIVEIEGKNLTILQRYRCGWSPWIIDFQRCTLR